ncbi:MAG: gliding motility protein GldN [Bacteroidaceae bacterium]|nr:gliding motility protein GldN [Candidatus Colenecus caballi]MCQ2073427.1 gliding motility protein GldN [Bacteroidaceae bacterium]
MKKVILIALALAVPAAAGAQSQKRLQEQAAKEAAEKSPTGVTLSERAKSQYTAQTAMPTEITWKRDIYRELDLKKEKNAALYYPEEPLGDRVNFFTLILNLILDGRIKAYEYRLDGNELFTKENELDIENMLEKFYIPFENDGKTLKVSNTDIPSSEIGKYYIKESNYLDQLSNYQTRVTAICPVLLQSNFGDQPTAYPMFWLNYDEISPYLGQVQVMTSSYNNTTNMSLDDYFVMRQYDGDIYKTSNLRNETLFDYCETDSALQAERARIEKQLTDFQQGLWNERKESGDKKAEEVKPAKQEKEPKQKKEKEPKAPKQKASSGERIGVHR